MDGSATRTTAPAGHAPEDLRIFQERLAAVGIRVSLPTAGPSDPLAEPLDLGAGLSDAIIAVRSGE